MPNARTLLLVLTTPAACAFASGCSGIERIAQCETFVGEVSQGLERVRETLPDAGSLVAEDYRRVADRYDTLNEALEKVELADAPLSEAADRYRRVISLAGERARSYATALDGSSASAKKRHRRESELGRIEKLARGDVGRESTALRKINELCHPR